MSRTFLVRGLAAAASATALIVGCSGAPTEGDLPKAKVATPEEMENLQKELLQKKVGEGKYKPPPGINLPKR